MRLLFDILVPRPLHPAEPGQTMAEYGIVLGVITIGTLGMFTALSGNAGALITLVLGILPS
jgi:hypothetical protein